jgi:hypothetical protein
MHPSEALIQEAISRGEFDHLPGAGKPLDLSAYFDTPEEVRLAYSILKNADVLPREVELLREIALLKEELQQSSDENVRRELSRAMEERLLKYRLMVERRR